MAIKPVLREELRNSRRLLSEYGRRLAKLPKGSLVSRVVRGRTYYYLVTREGGKVKVEYRGKVPAGTVERYREAKRKRAQYRKLASRLKRQITYLKGALRGKEAI
jgi:hypothetical protein